MNKNPISLLVAGLIAAFAIGLSTAPAKEKVPVLSDWSKLKVIPYCGGQVGFFDSDLGNIYLYDSKFERCTSLRLEKEPSPQRKRLHRNTQTGLILKLFPTLTAKSASSIPTPEMYISTTIGSNVAPPFGNSLLLGKELTQSVITTSSSVSRSLSYEGSVRQGLIC